MFLEKNKGFIFLFWVRLFEVGISMFFLYDGVYLERNYVEYYIGFFILDLNTMIGNLLIVKIRSLFVFS